jgi:hypothetical protein
MLAPRKVQNIGSESAVSETRRVAIRWFDRFFGESSLMNFALVRDKI